MIECVRLAVVRQGVERSALSGSSVAHSEASSYTSGYSSASAFSGSAFGGGEGGTPGGVRRRRSFSSMHPGERGLAMWTFHVMHCLHSHQGKLLCVTN